MNPIPCSACQKPIVFLKTINGKMMPVDAETVTGPAEFWDIAKNHMTHFATCSSPELFRKTKKNQEEEFNRQQ